MKKKINVILIIAILCSLLSVCFFSIYFARYLSTMIDSSVGYGSFSHTWEVFGRYFMNSLFCEIFSIAVLALLITLIIYLNKTDIATITAPFLTNFREKRELKAERKRQAKIIKAKETIEN